MIRIVTYVVLFILLHVSFPILRAQAESGDQVITGEQLFAQKCTPCHSQKRVERRKKSREKWEETVRRMQAKVPEQISPEEAEAIVDYLTEHFGSGD